jgi:hypothetical protein
VPFVDRLHLSALAGPLLAVACVAASAGQARAGAAPTLQWERLAAGVQGGAATAVALSAGDDRLAIGDVRGLLLSRSGELARRLLHRGPVYDVAFVPEGEPHAGALLVASGRDLFRIDSDERTFRLSLSAGSGERTVGPIALIPGLAVVATSRGALVSRDLERWTPLSRSLPRGAVTAVALRREQESFLCWTVIDGRVWRTALPAADSEPDRASSRREVLSLAGAEGNAVDVLTDVPGVDLVVLQRSTLAVRDPRGAWRIQRPLLPTGAIAKRLVFEAGRLWLATDRGLLEADRLDGPWRRVAGPAASASIADVASDGRDVYVATDTGLVAGRVVETRIASARIAERPRASRFEGDPPIDLVHRAAIAHLQLGAHRLEAWRKRVNRRSWMPVATLRSGYDKSRGLDWDFDESFVSGETRFLTDREEGYSRDWDLGITLIWDLPGLVYHPEEVDVSRETRELIELRKDVLDEITQLYFERQRVLADLASRDVDGDDAAERSRLRLRAEELAAGIDAWTGGWFRRHGVFE